MNMDMLMTNYEGNPNKFLASVSFTCDVQTTSLFLWFSFFSYCLIYLSTSRWSTTSFIKLSLTTLDITNLSTWYILLPIQGSLNQVPNIHLVFQILKLTVKWFQAYSFDFISWMAGIFENIGHTFICLSQILYILFKNTFWLINSLIY